MRVSTLLFVLGLLLSPAGGLLADESEKEAPEQTVFEFPLGHEPTGSAADLPEWALGNLTIGNFYPDSGPTLEVIVNILPELLREPPKTHSVRPGQLVTVPLKSGIGLVFYFKVKPVKYEVKEERHEGETAATRTINGYDVTLIVRKLSPAKP